MTDEPIELPNDMRELVANTARQKQGRARVVVCTGAGISAASGIPTFRGPEGYWTVGAREYHPQEMATLSAFRSMPGEVWRWYLYRIGVCRGAEPNAAHRALAEWDAALGDRFLLITQNVDGLHLRGGSTPDRMCEVHGNIEYRRCTGDCSGLLRMPNDLPTLERDTPLPDRLLDSLACSCGAPTRPHVLWFDEYYDEELYRSSTAMTAAASCDLFVIIGTSGAASLPLHATMAAAENGAAVIDINPEPNPFRDVAERIDRGGAIHAGADVVPELVRSYIAAEQPK